MVCTIQKIICILVLYKLFYNTKTLLNNLYCTFNSVCFHSPLSVLPARLPRGLWTDPLGITWGTRNHPNGKKPIGLWVGL